MELSSGRRPQIFYSNQRYQFTSTVFVAWLQGEEIKIRWTGRKRCYDNILVVRLWRRLKFEEVCLRAYSEGWEAEVSHAGLLWK
jgi:putative transposase